MKVSVFFCSILFIGASFCLYAQEEDERVIIGDPQLSNNGRLTLSGTVSGKEEGEGLFAATVGLLGSNKGVVTGVGGQFELILEPGDHVLLIQFLGKQTRRIPITLFSSGRLDVLLIDDPFALEGVTIEAAAADRNIVQISSGVNQVAIKDIESLPTFMGEVDVIQSLQTLPGVSSVGEGASGFNVRGGRTDQNLILQDGAILFNANHVLGFFSSFNPDATEDFTLFKGNMPAQFGGRVASVLDVRMREGNSERINVKGGLGLVASRLSVEGPLNQGRTRIMVAARASYSDWVLRQAKNIDVVNSDVRFHDLNAKLSHRLGDDHKLILSYYQSGDYFNFANDFGFEWDTRLVNFNWRWSLSERLVSSTRIVRGDYGSQLFDPAGVDAASVDNGMAYWQGNQSFYYSWQDRHNLTFGFDWVGYDAHPEISQPLSDESIILADRVEKEQANEFALFLNDQFELSERLGISLGLRYSFFQNRGPYDVYLYAVGEERTVDQIIDTVGYSKGSLIKQYAGFEPRLGLRYKLNESTALKASINRSIQYIHTLSNATAATPTDILQLSNSYFEPLISDNFSIGYFKNFKNNQWEFSLEGYFRRMQNLMDYKDFVDLLMNDHLETDVLAGDGRAYGMELLLRKTKGKLTGWLAYTLSRTEMRIEGETDRSTINRGEWYPTNFDQTHNVSLVSTLTIKGASSMNWNIIYATGRPINAIESNYLVGNTVISHFSDRNQYRIPDYFRVDLSFTFGRDLLNEKYMAKRENKRYQGTMTIGVYNILGRRNAYSIYFQRPELRGLTPQPHRLTVLGAAFPTITYNFEF